MGGVHSVSYSNTDGGNIYAINGPDPFGAVNGIKSEGLVIDINNGKLKTTFNGEPGFQNPHDVASSLDGNVVYVVELNPFKVWKLTNGKN